MSLFGVNIFGRETVIARQVDTLILRYILPIFAFPHVLHNLESYSKPNHEHNDIDGPFDSIPPLVLVPPQHFGCQWDLSLL